MNIELVLSSRTYHAIKGGKLHVLCIRHYESSLLYPHRFYSAGTHFHRMLHLLANEVMLKARDIVGEDILDDPEMVKLIM